MDELIFPVDLEFDGSKTTNPFVVDLATRSGTKVGPNRMFGDN